MKGKILGFDAVSDSGVITTTEGARYIFKLADWRGGERVPSAGAAVDFAPQGEQAGDIYPVGANFSAEGLSGPQMDRAVALFKQSLATPLACVVLFACFLPAISGPAQTLSLFGLGNLPDIGGAASIFGARGARTLSTLQSLLFLRFAAPLCALWLIWSAWSGNNLRRPMLATGGAAILAALLVYMLRSALLSAMGFMRDAAADMLVLGLGTWLIALAGVALILAALNIIRNPLAKG